jgi:ATP-binding cassette subfamily E protein 1
MSTYLADRVIFYDGVPSVECTAHSPCSLLGERARFLRFLVFVRWFVDAIVFSTEGMNAFLRQLQITFRRDPTNWRPRINKHDSVKDTEQKASGNYFFLEDGGGD